MTAEVDSEAHEPPKGIGAHRPEGDRDEATLGVFEQRFANLESITDSQLGYMSLEEMLSELLERIRSALEVDTAALLLLDEDRRVLVARAARGLEEEVRQGVRIPLGRGFAGRVAAQAQPIIIEDLRGADVVSPILRQKGIHSMLGVPVHVEGHVIGVMHIGTLKRRVFGQSDVTLLQHAADRAALAIDNARLSEQRFVTEIMQRTLLPDALPQIPGLRFSAKYLPAGSGIKVGGDWYDVFELANGHLALVIGDVVGRGVSAASLMAELRTALRAYLLERHELVDAVSLLNELLMSMGRNRGATAAIVELDLERGELQAVSAGHLPLLVVRPDGHSQFLDGPQGLPLGISTGQKYVSHRHSLPVGGVLLLYTDGLVERPGDSIDEGLARLRQAAEQASLGDEASFADRVYRTLLEKVSLHDDVAMLAIEALALGPTVELTLDAHSSTLPGLRRTLGRWLASVGATDSELFDITLAASEATANSIEHAYGARQATLSVRCEHDGAHVQVSVCDEGRWRTARPFGRGRGLAIMRTLMDSVAIERSEQGTTVIMTKNLSRTS